MRYMPTAFSLGMKISMIGIIAFITICVVDIILKRSIFKNKTYPNIDTPWVLEDFDEDNEQFLALSEEENENSSFIKRIFTSIKNKRNKNGDN